MNVGEISKGGVYGLLESIIANRHESPCLLAISTASPEIEIFLDEEIVFFL
jgi:hypothetical protein